MKETDKRRTPNSNQSKRSAKSERRNGKPNGPHQTSNGKEIESKALHAKPNPSVLVSDTNTGSEPSEVYEKNVVIHYVDDVNKFEGAPHESKANAMIAKVNKVESLGDHSSDLENGSKQGKEEESDSETIKDSVSSQGDSVTLEDVKIEKSSKVSTSVSNKNFSESYPHGTRLSEHGTSKSRLKAVTSTPKKPVKSNKGSSRVTNKGSFDCNAKDMKIPPKPSSESSEGLDDKAVEDLKDVDAMDEASNGTQSVASDNETVDAEEIGEHEDEDALSQRIEEMEMRIEKLEEELREVAALEISLYSVVPEHGSSAHKVHTSARRLSRLYIHGCKHWTQDRRATIAKNTVSGLVLIAKSCGNDVPRLTFWLSNTIVLREIISQAFGTSCHSSSLARLAESNGGSKGSEIKATLLKWKGGISGGKQVNGRMHFDEDWQETGTLAAALEKVESWIFSRIVESVWWQALTPHMQSPNGNLSNKTIGRLLGPALGDQQQGSFSINLWKTAFQDALQRLCPVRGGGHVCGCLPIIARMVMEQCVARLDVAMFNAILRESAHEIPTDPVSDPILDSKVLPIPAGDLSFGSGAQLKNSVGNWSRWLTDMFGMDVDDSAKEVTQNSDDDDHDRQDDELKSFPLLNDLSDLLMLPKDMLIDRSIRMEVCPLISLPLVKRILCNFTPDEFCPDSVPGAVLEALNAESIVERRLSGETARNFPYTATPVVYTPPCSADVAEKVAEAEARSHLSRNVSVVQRKGYTSDEELEELDSPLASVIEKLPQSPTILSNGTGKYKEHTVHRAMTNARYKLLREVWSA